MLNPLQTKTINYKNLKPPTTLQLCSKVLVQRKSSYLNKINIIFSQGSMFSAKLEIIFCKIGSTFTNVGVWSCIDEFLSEDFPRVSVPRGVFSANLSKFSPRNIFFSNLRK